MTLTKQQVIERFCKLATKVGEQEFKHTIPHDCFCGDDQTGTMFTGDFQFDEKVLEFIEECVETLL